MYVGFEDKNLYLVMAGYQLKIMIAGKEIGIKKLLKKWSNIFGSIYR